MSETINPGRSDEDSGTSPGPSSTSGSVPSSESTTGAGTGAPAPSPASASAESSSPATTGTENDNDNELRNRIPGTSTAASSSIPQPQSQQYQMPPPPPQPYSGYTGNMTSYCKELESWLQRAHLQRECAVSAYFTALNMMFGGSAGINRGSTNGSELDPTLQALNYNNNFGPWMNMNNLRQPGGISPIIRRFLVRGVRTNNNVIAIDFNMAPVWKRILAECIDFVLLLVVKLFVTVTIIDSFELIDLDNIDLDALQESGGLLEVAVSLTWELLILELTHRIVVCFFEAWCLSKSGSTPGKNVLNLRVLHCDQVIQLAPDQPGMDNNGLVIPVGPGRILVSPGSFLTFPRALLRSAIKNFSLAFFFPFAFVFFHLEQSRTIYDLATKSIVVEIRH